MSAVAKLDVAIDELVFALKSEENRENREHYINNAIMFIEEVKELLNINQ
ncbi:hypothetical protein IFU39_16550 [Paenibacillus sp. CFBP 13594]|nr:hypothetical protein [Paenibacillus sp. CFBP 13594]MBD8839424.1 hypothetical protein [Paenibacillus sp. CFBP 13594]